MDLKRCIDELGSLGAYLYSKRVSLATAGFAALSITLGAIAYHHGYLEYYVLGSAIGGTVAGASLLTSRKK